MRTSCPHCSTCYDVDPDLLQDSQGLARCFRCNTLFDTTTGQAVTGAEETQAILLDAQYEAPGTEDERSPEAMRRLAEKALKKDSKKALKKALKEFARHEGNGVSEESEPEEPRAGPSAEPVGLTAIERLEELRKEIRDELREEFRAEFRDDGRGQPPGQPDEAPQHPLPEGLKAELRAELREELRAELREELRETLLAELQARPEDETRPLTETGHDTQAETLAEPAPATESEAGPGLAPGQAMETQAEPEPTSGPETDVERFTGTESEPAPEAESGPESETQPDSESESDRELESGPKPEAGPQTQTEAAPESEVQLETEPELKPELASAVETESETEAHTEPEPEPDTDTEPAPESAQTSTPDAKPREPSEPDELPFEVPDKLEPLMPSADAALDVADALDEKRSHKALVYGLLATLLLVGLGLQLAWQQRDALLAQFPWLSPACDYLPCRPQMVRAPEQFRVMQRELRPAANQPDTLTLDATIRNDAELPQPLPDLQLSLLDNNGAVLIRRRLAPAEYLFPPPSDDRLIDPGEVFTITLDFKDPGYLATGFVIDFL